MNLTLHDDYIVIVTLPTDSKRGFATKREAQE